MSDYRYDAHATITPGEFERLIDARVQLVRVVLSDSGPVVAPDGSEHQRPDVICHLRPTQARELAEHLLALATHAEEITPR